MKEAFTVVDSSVHVPFASVALTQVPFNQVPFTTNEPGACAPVNRAHTCAGVNGVSSCGPGTTTGNPPDRGGVLDGCVTLNTHSTPPYVHSTTGGACSRSVVSFNTRMACSGSGTRPNLHSQEVLVGGVGRTEPPAYVHSTGAAPGTVLCQENRANALGNPATMSQLRPAIVNRPSNGQPHEPRKGQSQVGSRGQEPPNMLATATF